MPFDPTEHEPVENTPISATLTLQDGQVIKMPAALSAEQVEALAYVACLFVEPLKAAALGQAIGGFMRRAARELVLQELANRKLQQESGKEPPVTPSEG